MSTCNCDLCQEQFQKTLTMVKETNRIREEWPNMPLYEACRRGLFHINFALIPSGPECHGSDNGDSIE